MNTENLGKPLPFGFYDTRQYRTVPVAEGYGIWARTYSLPGSFDIDLFRSSKRLAHQIAGARMLDIGCGTGRIGSWAHEHGPQSLTGVDVTPEMLREAEKTNVYTSLIRSDVMDLGTGERFDVIVSSLAVCHIEDLMLFYLKVAGLLNPKGLFCMVDYHPHFLLNGIPSHFMLDESGEQIAIENHVHSLSGHFNCAAAAGLHMAEFMERYVDDGFIREQPSIEKYRGQPVTFMMGFSAG